MSHWFSASRLEKSFDLIGGIKRLVQNKTVAVKLNLTGLEWKPVFGLPAQETYQTQPNTVAALCALLAEAGAKRIVLVENLYWDKPFEQVLIEAGWDVKPIHSAGHHRVSFEDTRNRGQWPGYSRLKVPWGGFMYPAFDFNQRFENCDVLVSLAKLKQHATAGVTGAVKNCFGNTPTSLYGDTAPDEKGLIHRAVMFHGGKKQVPKGVPAELENGHAKERPDARATYCRRYLWSAADGFEYRGRDSDDSRRRRGLERGDRVDGTKGAIGREKRRVYRFRGDGGHGI